jgi:hypothetical protein
MDADASVGSLLEGEAVPGWVCSLLIINVLFSILHRHNSVRADNVFSSRKQCYVWLFESAIACR